MTMSISEQVIKDLQELQAIGVRVPAKAFKLAQKEKRVQTMRDNGMKIHEISDALIMEAL